MSFYDYFRPWLLHLWPMGVVSMLGPLGAPSCQTMSFFTLYILVASKNSAELMIMLAYTVAYALIKPALRIEPTIL